MIRDEHPYDEYKTVVQYPPDPPRPCGSEPFDIPAGRHADLAQTRARFHRKAGGSATVYRRTWTPSPWVAVDQESADGQ